jgi:hypothetical protein
MDGISVYWKDIDLLVIVTDSFSHKRPSTGNVSKKGAKKTLTFSVSSSSQN